MSERTIIAVVSEFRATGLTVEQQILMDELVMLMATLQAQAAVKEERREQWREDKRVLRMSTDVRGSPKTPIPLIYKTNNKKPPLPPATDGFENFYSVFPKKVGRGSAAKAYRNALKRGANEEILAGAKRYAAERVGQDAKYTAAPASWLNADRWLDEPERKLTVVGAPQRTWAEQKDEYRTSKRDTA